MESGPIEGCKPLTNEEPQSELQQSKVISTSRFSNYIEIGLKFPNYKKYHLHSFVDSGSGFTIAKRFAIPEELWIEDNKRIATGIQMDGSRFSMNKVAKDVKITIGGGNFTIKSIWQAEGQGSDILLGNDFLLQQTMIQNEAVIGFEKGNNTFWTARLKQAKSIVGPNFTSQYQKSQQNRGDYKPRFETVLQYKKQEELLIEDSSEEEEEKMKKQTSFMSII
ncbi:hypothetical protein M0R45_030347 [Rubus argutus]|uniref:Peptidase A3A domain-containing protein n=1 Tax=Rubus argutus TaxID=59490 RepID=A0AAW1WDC5_RUBAR